MASWSSHGERLRELNVVNFFGTGVLIPRMKTAFVARGFIPAGRRSSPRTDLLVCQSIRLLGRCAAQRG